MPKTKKKVIALVVDTDLTNEQIEQQNLVELVVYADGFTQSHDARNVRVLDSD